MKLSPPICRRNNELHCKNCLSRTKGEVSSQDEYAVLIRMSLWEQFLKTELRPICEKWKCFPAHYLERLSGDPHYPGMHSWQCQCARCSGPGGIHYLAIDFPPALKDVQEKNMNSFQDRLPAFGGNLKGVLSQQRELAPSCLQTQTLLALIWCTCWSLLISKGAESKCWVFLPRL